MRIPSGARWVACLLLALAMACSDPPRPPTGPSPPGENRPPGPGGGNPPPNTPNRTAVLVAVGDIGMCGPNGPLASVAQTAHMVEGIDGQVVLAGDLAYMQGTPQDFVRCFDPHWGQFRRRWRPVPGNHEYETRDAAGYFQYFGEAAGSGGRPYYSFRAGDWLVLMLNSNVEVRSGSAQFEFVRAELQATPARCAMAVWHHPLFSSGPNGPNRFMRDMWKLLYDGGAEVIVAGHDHFYERYGKQDVDARSDPAGLRQFIVGTGGAHLSPFLRTEPNSQARISEHGVLRLTLHDHNYEWAFVQTNGAIADPGGDSCH